MCHKVTGKGYENTHPHLRGPTYGNAGGTEVGVWHPSSPES